MRELASQDENVKLTLATERIESAKETFSVCENVCENESDELSESTETSNN
jgi:hypothetical protein